MSLIQHISHAQGPDSSRPHTHSGYHQMLYIRRGSLDLRVSDHAYTVDHPSVVFIGCHEPHALAVHSEIYERTLINLYPHKLGLNGNARLLSVFSDRPAGFCHVLPVGEDAERLDLLLALLADEWKRRDSEFLDEPERLLCSALLMLFRRSPEFFPSVESRRATTVQRIKSRIEGSLVDPPSLELLGEEFHMSPYYLSHLFKELTGYSIKNYHLLCRVAAARELLETTDRSITEIAARVGFYDASSLSRYMQRELGCTPTQYRKNIQRHQTTDIHKEDPS